MTHSPDVSREFHIVPATRKQFEDGPCLDACAGKKSTVKEGSARDYEEPWYGGGCSVLRSCQIILQRIRCSANCAPLARTNQHNVHINAGHRRFAPQTKGRLKKFLLETNKIPNVYPKRLPKHFNPIHTHSRILFPSKTTSAATMVLDHKDVNAPMMAETQPAGVKDTKSLEYHRQVLQSKMAEQAYVLRLRARTWRHLC